MRYSFISAAVLALSSSVFAQTPGFDAISSPTQDQNVPAGTSLDIVWQPSTNYTGAITIRLLEGSTPNTLSPGAVVAASIDQTLGKFTWAIPTTTPSFATYGFQISLDSDPTIFQYSFPFHITGLSGSTSTSTSATGSATSTTTIQLAQGPAYSSTSSSSSATVTSSTSSNTTVTTVTSSTSSKPSSNVTLSTTLTKTSSPTTTSSSTGGAATVSKSAAVGKAATGGLAMVGGLILAFAL